MRINISQQQVRDAFEQVKHYDDFKESAALVERGGLPVEMLQALCLRPEILDAFGRFGSCVYPGGLIEQSVKEMVIIEASRRNSCQFCADSHIAVAKMLNISDDPVRALDNPELLTERERLAVEYTAAVMENSTQVSDELFERLRKQYNDAELVELTFLIGFINMLNLFNNALQVTYRGEYDAIEA